MQVWREVSRRAGGSVGSGEGVRDRDECQQGIGEEGGQVSRSEGCPEAREGRARG